MSAISPFRSPFSIWRTYLAENPYISAILFTANGWYFSLFCLLLSIVFIVPFVGAKIYRIFAIYPNILSQKMI
nr:MAG TPA: hypothetical protein [Caudoviricetes sp.]